jgi:hypothetical protein
MKYIRKFNEGKNITDDLEVCSENLAYLIDGGFHILYSTGFYNARLLYWCQLTKWLIILIKFSSA